jgi:hypothetical protein
VAIHCRRVAFPGKPFDDSPSDALGTAGHESGFVHHQPLEM